ncbi:MAG: oligopeptide/dipeptide ABC transporter ATP-binding protein [Acidothermaceae bacterium]
MPTKPDDLLDADVSAGALGSRPVVLDVRDLRVHFALRGGFADRLLGRSSGSVKAVDGVSFTLHKGEVLGLVGESGSGKTTTARALLGLAPITGGSVVFDAGAEAGGRIELTHLRERQFRSLRQKIQLVFQDPHASLNPAMDLATAVAHPLKIHKVTSDRAEIDRRVRDAFERVGLSPADRYLRKFPADLSGGQKQRAVLARSIMLNPALLVADEPVSMLDMSVRAKILELMLDLKRDLELTYVYVTHDLATAKFFCDTIAIMYLGRIVEIGPAAQIYADPKHPYTRSLLAAIPEPDPRRSVTRNLPRGEVPDAARPPMGCSFHPRCSAAFEPCGWEARDVQALLEQRWTNISEEQYETERTTVASPVELEVDGELGRRALLPDAKSGLGAAAVLLDELKSADPDEPFWRGVQSMQQRPDGVELLFRDPVDPGLLQHGPVQVACHLHDPRFATQAGTPPPAVEYRSGDDTTSLSNGA